MPNGDHYDLRIEGIKVIALPNGKEIKTKQIGKELKYTLDLKDIPIGKRYLSIEIKTRWV